MHRKYLLLLICFLISGCGTLNADYVRADRDTFNAIAPSFKKYVEADESLTDDQVRDRLLTLDTWNKRIERGENLVEDE